MPGLTDWLRSLSEDALTALLSRRPDVLAPPEPRTLGELAQRLESGYSAVSALRGVTLPAVQVLEAAAALGGAPTRDRLAALLGVAPDDPALGGALNMVVDRALAWPDGERIWVAAGLADAWPTPLDLGAPVADFLAVATADTLRRLCGALDLPAAGRKADLLATVTRRLGDDETVRRLAAEAPAETRRLLHEAAIKGPQIEVPPLVLYGSSGRPRGGPADWAVERGLLFRVEWNVAEMPAEIALALRGPGYRAAFDPVPPPVPTTTVDAATVRADAAAAATRAVDAVAALVELCAATPLGLRKRGGIAVREVRRAAKAIGDDERGAGLWLTVALEAGLVDAGEDGVTPTDRYDTWRAGRPADRLAALVEAWWQGREDRHALVEFLAAHPGACRPDAVVEALTWYRPLDPPGEDTLYAAGRLGLVAHGTLTPLGRALRETPSPTPEPGHPPTGVAETTAGGQAPPGATGTGGQAPAEATGSGGQAPPGATGTGGQAPAEATGSGGQASPGATAPGGQAPTEAAGRGGQAPAGGAVPGGQGAGVSPLVRAAGVLLPAAESTARFQADLTAVVAGIPTAELVAVLDAAAVREARGTASVWRFSPASVRRALDAGTDPDTLLADLAAVSTGALPQPLEYLVRDLARRHGQVRVRPVACCLTGDDPALLAEIAAARRLTPLGLTMLAPTVLASARPLDETLAALRAAGYAPVAEDSTGAIVREGPAERRVTAEDRRTGGDRRRGGDRRADPQGAARRLRTAPAALPADDALVEVIGAATPGLTDAERRMLAHAAEHGTPVRIGYVNAEGRATDRVVEDITLTAGMMLAWCRLRSAERMFALSRIESVSPA